jgi:histone deacetylase 11
MKIMIVDLDAHQGNGHERDHMDDENTYIVDAYNHNIYPGDDYAQNAIKYDIVVTSRDNDD